MLHFFTATDPSIGVTLQLYCSQFKKKSIWLSDLSIFSVPDTCYSRNEACALNLMYTYVLIANMLIKLVIFYVTFGQNHLTTWDTIFYIYIYKNIPLIWNICIFVSHSPNLCHTVIYHFTVIFISEYTLEVFR